MIELIPAIDIIDGKCVRLTQGDYATKKVYNEDPLEVAKMFEGNGIRRLHVVDLDGAREGRIINYRILERIATRTSLIIDFGGGLKQEDDLEIAFESGAQMVTGGSIAVKNPEIISQGADAFGSQAIVVGMDVKRVPATPEIPSGYEIVIHGGRKAMGIDAVEWAKRCEALGAGELCVNSIDADGTKDGYELTLTRRICDAVRIPVIASGGAGSPQHMVDAVTEGRASAALIASIVHYGEYTIGQLKQYMADRGVPVRLTW